MSAGRKYYTKKEWDAQLEKQGGECATCSSTGPFDADHETPNAWEPGKPTQLLCKPCHKAKTKLDVKKIYKVLRIQKRARGEIRKKKPIPSRGFRTDVKRKMNGETVKRGK